VGFGCKTKYVRHRICAPRNPKKPKKPKTMSKAQKKWVKSQLMKNLNLKGMNFSGSYMGSKMTGTLPPQFSKKKGMKTRSSSKKGGRVARMHG
tara:strand:- start:19100 stop:19378 length:279 start_codon:yes stop_codon:yes gene_type:complete